MREELSKKLKKSMRVLPFDQFVQKFIAVLCKEHGWSEKEAFDRVRFTSALDTQGIRSDVMSVQDYKYKGKTQYNISQNLISLLGPNGVMPSFYDEYVASQLKEKQGSLDDFLNLFVHRLSLAYLEIEDRHKPLRLNSRRSDENSKKEADFLTFMSHFGGFLKDEEGERDRVHFTGSKRLKYLGTQFLSMFLHHHLKADIRISEFHGQWKTVPPRYSFRLGESHLGSTKGQARILGSRMFTIANRIDIAISKISFENMDDLNPSGGLRIALNKKLRELVPPHIQIGVSVEIPRNWHRRSELGGGMFLGWSSRLVTEKASLAKNYSLSWTI